MDDLNVEVKRRDASIDMVHSEKERVLTRLEQEESELSSPSIYTGIYLYLYLLSV